MKGMPLPFDFEGKGELDLQLLIVKNNTSTFGEPTSVLDSARISSSSTLSSSHGGGGGAASDANPSPRWQQDHTTATSSNAGEADSVLLPVPPSLEIAGGNPEKIAMEDWESVLSDSSPTQEQSILRWIMGDVEDPAMGSLNKVVQIGGSGSEFEFNGGGFGAVDQGFGGEQFGATSFMSFPNNNLGLGPLSLHQPPQLLINQQNPSFFFPLQQQEHSIFGQPQAKRHHPVEISNGTYTDTGQQQQMLPRGDELGHQQAVVDQLYKAAELVQTGNPVLAQGILARLNHHLSPIGKPFHRAAFYCKEALHQLLLQTSTNNTNPPPTSPFTIVLKIGAYKSFSEISPFIQFANFTCNQALLEVFDGFDRIHIVDFDIGYGGQWASLIQELAQRTPTPTPALKITAVVSPWSHDQLELGLTRQNLIQFANEVNIAFEFQVMSLDSLNSGSWSLPENEAVAVNLPVASYQMSLPLVLGFVKQLSPRIVVSVDRGCDRTDLPFANHVIHALQSYSNLLESLDAVNVNMDALQKIERFLVQSGLEKIVMGRSRSPGKTQHWRTLFLSSGFSPLTFSNFTESQAECLVKRTPVRGFQVEKRQSSLVLCWQRKELISASAWRC